MLSLRKDTLAGKSDKLQYSNCWEDATLLLEALAPKEGKRILSIASAGDSSFSLLTSSPEEILAIDNNEAQLALVELKKMAIKHLTYQEVLEFLGFSDCEARLKYYHYLKGWLSFDAQVYWNQRLDSVKEGIIFQGKFEKYFSFFARKILPMIHSEELIQEMFVEKSPIDQAYFYMQHWNSLKWRLLFKLFFNKHVMGKFGRHPDFKNSINIPVEDYLFQKTESQLSSISSAHNPFLRFALTGNFGKELPHYLKPENFPLIKENIDRLQIKKESFKKHFNPDRPFDYFNLARFLENTQGKSLANLAQSFAERSNKQARFAYLNFSLLGRLSEALPRHFYFDQQLSEELGKKDQGFFIRSFVSEEKI